MNYKQYLSGLVPSHNKVVAAKRDGVVLSRYEKFDFMFKKELAIKEGRVKRKNSLNALRRSLTDRDYRLAKFYAKSLSDIMIVYQTGYSFRNVVDHIRSVIGNAKSLGICSNIRLWEYEDVNNVLSVYFKNSSTKEKALMVFEDKDDYLDNMVSLVSLLGSMSESTVDGMEWFDEYLKKELSKIKIGVEARPFIEIHKINRELSEYAQVFEKDVDSGRGKVIDFPNTMYN